MADLADVEAALVASAGALLYPAGTGSPSAAGVPVRVFRGWPVAGALDSDIAAGRACVSVFARPGTSRLTTRFARHWVQLPTAPPGVTATVAGTTATFTGTATGPTDCGVRAFDQSHTVHVAAGATASTVAAALGALVPGAVVLGAALTVPGCTDLAARTATPAQLMREVRRQSQVVSLIVWAPTPAAREAIAAVIDAGMAGISFLTLAEGSRARLTYSGSGSYDETGKAALWRRDLSYSVEYATTETRTVPRNLWPTAILRSPAGQTLARVVS